MPVRSLSSSVMKWPDLATVTEALRRWVGRAVQGRGEVMRVGFFGSYARGDWGVGSDLDLLIIVSDAGLPFERRAIEWDATDLPVPADVLVYTVDEWESMRRDNPFGRRLARETHWLYGRQSDGPA